MTYEPARHAPLIRESAALAAPELHRRQREALAAAFAAGGVDPVAPEKLFERAWIETIVDTYLRGMRDSEAPR